MDQNPFQVPTSISDQSPVSVSHKSRLPPIAFCLGVIIAIAGTLMLCFHFGFMGGLFVAPITFGPLMLAWIPMWLCRSKRSQGVLVFANIAFICLFLYVYLPLLYPHNVPELDGLGMFVIGIFSFPLLLISCIIAAVLHRHD